jgi:hypothetical protein
MTRRERLEARIEKRQEWAEKAVQKSTASFIRAHELTANIPFGQPILVGHHSERCHRRTIERSDSAMRNACELSDKAEMHESKAANLGHMLDKAIFSDDSDAVEAIQARITANEAAREKMKKINSLYRKADVDGLEALGVDYEAMKAKLAVAGSHWGRAPHLPFELSNLGGRITADRKRLIYVNAQQARAEKAKEAPGGVIIEGSGEYIRVTFSAKPERGILNDLRNAGFRWGGGSWTGQRVKLPSSITI